MTNSFRCPGGVGCMCDGHVHAGEVYRPEVVVEAEAPVVEGAADLQALAGKIEARREAERTLDEELDAAFAALVEPEAK